MLGLRARDSAPAMVQVARAREGRAFRADGFRHRLRRGLGDEGVRGEVATVTDQKEFRNRRRVRTKAGWARDVDDLPTAPHELVRVHSGVALGEVFIRQEWTVILWDDHEDPVCFKTAGLEDE